VCNAPRREGAQNPAKRPAARTRRAGIASMTNVAGHPSRRRRPVSVWEVDMPRATHPALRRLGSLITSSALATTVLLGSAAIGAPALATAAPTCSLGPNGAVKHVVYVQFDNTHFRRDLPNVPSDLEQMPNLRNFMKDNGTLLTNDH